MKALLISNYDYDGGIMGAKIVVPLDDDIATKCYDEICEHIKNDINSPVFVKMLEDGDEWEIDHFEGWQEDEGDDSLTFTFIKCEYIGYCFEVIFRGSNDQEYSYEKQLDMVEIF